MNAALTDLVRLLAEVVVEELFTEQSLNASSTELTPLVPLAAPKEKHRSND